MKKLVLVLSFLFCFNAFATNILKTQSSGTLASGSTLKSIDANGKRKKVMIYNHGPGIMSLKWATASTTLSNGYNIASGATYLDENPSSDDLYISAFSGAVDYYVFESESFE